MWSKTTNVVNVKEMAAQLTAHFWLDWTLGSSWCSDASIADPRVISENIKKEKLIKTK